jgi:hypothetical protein
MAEKVEIRFVVVRDENYLHQVDIAAVILHAAEALPDADARQMVKQLANNILAGKKLRRGGSDGRRENRGRAN